MLRQLEMNLAALEVVIHSPLPTVLRCLTLDARCLPLITLALFEMLDRNSWICGGPKDLILRDIDFNDCLAVIHSTLPSVLLNSFLVA